MSRLYVNHRLDKVLLWLFILARVTSAQIQTTNVDTSTCGLTKSCWRLPDRCTTGMCDFLLTWTTFGNILSFEMEGKVPDKNSWVAFGLSVDTSMGDDSVVSCVYNSQRMTYDVQSSWNNGRINEIIVSNPQIGLKLENTSSAYVNGKVICKFERFIYLPGSPPSNWYATDSATYYILMASGSASQGYMQQHSYRVSSGEKFNFSSNTKDNSGDVADPTSLRLIKAHGILMVLAWMVFASFGMLMPRYFKMAWPNSTWCGAKIWFQIHQPCMIITLLLTAAGFIIIFVEEKGVYANDLPSPTLAHPPLGIIVMILVLINPLMAIFRCKPDARFRIVFNVCHFIVGLLSHVTAVVTIFLGLYMLQLNLPLWTKGVMAAFICFHALIEVVLAIHMHRDKFRRGQSTDFQDIAMESIGTNDGKKSGTKKVESGSMFKTIVLIIHLCVVLGCAIAISVQIGLS